MKAGKRFPLAPSECGGEWAGFEAVTTGDYRCPREGEWFISGAEPEAYRAVSDLRTPYFIAEPVASEDAAPEACPWFPEPFFGHVVPPFSLPGPGCYRVTYRYWMWHPCYPRWSRSCFHGSTEKEAYECLMRGGGEPCYARLLVKETEGDLNTELEVVCGIPPEDLRGWDPEWVAKCRPDPR